MRQLNTRLTLGLVLLALLAAFAIGGSFVTDLENAYPLSAPIAKAPSHAFPFGTDTKGRDLLPVLVLGTLLTVKIGLLAGTIGILIGTTLAFLAGHYGGWIDAAIRFVVDVLLTVPGLLALVVLASSFPGAMTSTTMGLVIACLAWREPARSIRAQVLVVRQAGYVQMARLSGLGGLSIIVREMVPNLLPYLGAALVAAISAGILASVGIEALGLGARDEPTLGMTVYWMMSEGAFIRGMWWWIMGPVVILIVLFVGLYLLVIGLDEFANPRLRRLG